MKISGTTKITGIFGCPIEHTFSPAMHNAAFEHLKLDFVYIPFLVAHTDLKEAAEALRCMNIHGVNITIPHKENIIKFLDWADPLAKKIGSVNTIVNRNGKLCGYNTDGRGFLKDLSENGVKPEGKTVLIIGAGGAGRAVSSALSFYKAKKIFITDKDEKKAKTLSGRVKNSVFIPFSSCHKAIKDADLLINATPIGMKTSDPALVNPEYLHKKLFVYDVIYNSRSRLLKDCAKLGIRHSDGLGMLLNQGALAFELWTGKRAPAAVMKKALLNTINY